MKLKRTLALLLAAVLAVSMIPAVIAAEPGSMYTDADGHWFFEPLEQGVFSDGGYTLEKISHPTLGAGMIDGILEGEDQDRGNSYSWSMAEAGDYVYIGTCYNSTYYIFHNNLETALKKFVSQGILSEDLNTSKIANDLVEIIFGVDEFDETKMNDWNPIIMAVNKRTGESEVVFCEREIWTNYPEIFPGYSPYLATKNYLSGYRMAFEFNGKLYFAGMGNPTATLIAIDPETREAEIAYYNINMTRGVSNGVHGLLVYDNEILMCLATDNYDGNGTPGGIIVASSDPTAGFDQWRVIGNQDDFDGLPGVMQVDGLNGGGIWDIIEYNGHLYVTIVTDKNIDGTINKQGFAMYRGDKQPDGSFTWTQVVGDHGTSGLPFGMGIDYSMSCNMWVYDGYLYMGTYNDPMLDLAEIPATGDFELLYHDLDHSIYLYRMNENEEFEMVGGKNDNPFFPEGPIGNLGAGLGSNSNQYVWRMGVHNDEFYIGTYDTSSLTYIFTQITDGHVAQMDQSDIAARADVLGEALLEVLQVDDPYLAWFLNEVLLSKTTTDLYQKLSGLVSGKMEGKNPVPEYEKLLADYEALKERVLGMLNTRLASRDFLSQYEAVSGVAVCSNTADPNGLIDELRSTADALFADIDGIIYNKYIHNFVYYMGCNFYAQSAEKGFDLLVSNDGVNFDAVTRNGFGDGTNHGLRTICSTEYGVFMGSANPFNGTQLWLMRSDRDADRTAPADDSCPCARYVDVDRSAWYHSAVDYCLETGLMNGTGEITFSPNGITTRAMVVTMLYRLHGQPAVTGENPFTDVKDDVWYTDAIIWAAENSVVLGLGNGTFAPMAPISREQLAAMLYRYADCIGADTSARGDLSVFTDTDTISDYAVEAMSWANGTGLMIGTGSRLYPQGNALRCQTAAVMMRCSEFVLE